jgi:hypothetical protein
MIFVTNNATDVYIRGSLREYNAIYWKNLKPVSPG